MIETYHNTDGFWLYSMNMLSKYTQNNEYCEAKRFRFFQEPNTQNWKSSDTRVPVNNT